MFFNPTARLISYGFIAQSCCLSQKFLQNELSNEFSGTGGVASTTACYKSNSVSGCDLDGRVVFRSIKLAFSPGTCMVNRPPCFSGSIGCKPPHPCCLQIKRLFNDEFKELSLGDHSHEPLTIPLIYKVFCSFPPSPDSGRPQTLRLLSQVPSGFGGVPSGDAALSVHIPLLPCISSSWHPLHLHLKFPSKLHQFLEQLVTNDHLTEDIQSKIELFSCTQPTVGPSTEGCQLIGSLFHSEDQGRHIKKFDPHGEPQ